MYTHYLICIVGRLGITKAIGPTGKSSPSRSEVANRGLSTMPAPDAARASRRPDIDGQELDGSVRLGEYPLAAAASEWARRTLFALSTKRAHGANYNTSSFHRSDS